MDTPGDSVTAADDLIDTCGIPLGELARSGVLADMLRRARPDSAGRVAVAAFGSSI